MDGTGTARILVKFWLLTVAVLAITVLYVAKVLFLPLAFAVLFAFLLAPVVGLLERTRLPRALAAMIVILGFGALLAGAAWLMFTQLVAIANDLPTYGANIAQKIEAFHTPSGSAFARAQEVVEELSEQLGIATSSSDATATDKDGKTKKPLGSTPERPVQVREVARPMGRLDQLHGVAEPLATTFLTIVFTFFIILQREELRNRLIRLTGEQNLTMTTHAIKDASARISRYFVLLLLVNLCLGALVAVALYIIGLPHALLFGAIAALARFIPYFGTLAAAALPTILSLAVFPGWTHSVEILCTFLVLEMFTANYAEPHIYGRHTGLTSLAILVSAAFWTLLWGPVGLILSMPLTVCLVVLGRHVPSLEFLTVMLGDRPAIEPPTSFYQRLLARDEREAAEILESCLKSDTLENIYDKMFIPALQMAVRDSERNDLAGSTSDFVHRTIRELIEELGIRENAGVESHDDPITVRAHGAGKKVLCLPARDETDELGAMMLAQLLETDGLHAVAVPASRMEEIMATVVRENPDLVFLSGMPQFAIARAQRVFRLLRARNPRLKIMLGFWGGTDNLDAAAAKFSQEKGFRVQTSLAEAVSEVRAFFHMDEELPESEPETAGMASSPSAL